MLVDFLSSWYVLQSSCQTLKADGVHHCYNNFPCFFCFAWVRCISTSLVAAHTKLAAQRGYLRTACVATSLSDSKYCSSSSKHAKYLAVYLGINL